MVDKESPLKHVSRVKNVKHLTVNTKREKARAGFHRLKWQFLQVLIQINLNQRSLQVANISYKIHNLKVNLSVNLNWAFVSTIHNSIHTR